ncbi:putative N-glycosylase/DNA lyase [archaeon BMS3Bbin16]|nr:putative N-glycosylase/DNA lyase [archaeon BMS3Bbin16]
MIRLTIQVSTVKPALHEYTLTTPIPVSSPPQRLDLGGLKSFRKKNLRGVEKRLSEFTTISSGSETRIFYELCYCILTPQSSGRVCDGIVAGLVKKGVLRDPESRRFELEAGLKKTRFWRNKSRYIIRAWERFASPQREQSLNGLLEMERDFTTPADFRSWLRGELRGLGIGMKEASHFLRNTGRYRGIAIVDRHVLACLTELDSEGGQGKGLASEKDYLRREEEMIDFSIDSGIPLEELDLLFWSARTGYIFK